MPDSRSLMLVIAVVAIALVVAWAVLASLGPRTRDDGGAKRPD